MSRHACSAVLILAISMFVPGYVSAQVSLAEQNVNMVSGTDWTTGDPFLQRQNEPSIAVSTRNNAHLLAGNNDYRMVDLPGLLGIAENGDAWLGLFKSFDGGQTWYSTLLPGFPLDASAAGQSSPLFGFQAASDPTVRSGPAGLFYYSGIAFNRTPANNALGEVFVARLIDNNNRENGDPTAKTTLTNLTPADSIRYLGATVISSGNSGQFLDKPWLAVDEPRNSNTCLVNFTNPDGTTGSETVPAARVFVAWSNFTGTGGTSKVNVAYSDNCGASFNGSSKISQTNSINQGTILAIDPSVPSTSAATIYVAWRRFASGGQNDAMVISKSTNGGVSWSKSTDVIDFPLSCATNNTAPGCQFDQLDGSGRFRSNDYPALAVDATGRVYLAASQRNSNGDARIVLTMSEDGGNTWSTPQPVDNGPVYDDYGNPFTNLSGRGHQIMPSLAFNAGELSVVYYDLRQDHTIGVFTPEFDSNGNVTGYGETRELVDELLTDPSSVFTPFIDDGTLSERRHTIDVQGAVAAPQAAGQSTMPAFNTFRISNYFVGYDPTTSQAEQLTVDPPDLPIFTEGTLAFMGDYIDVAGDPPFVIKGGKWQFNTSSANPQVFHAVWTDNRDVAEPPNGDWTQYVPPYSLSNSTTLHPSIFDPTQNTPQCVVNTNDQFIGTRNQNIYTSRIDPPLTIISPGNQKPLGYQAGSTTQLLQRAFPFYVKNLSNAQLNIRLTTTQPAAGSASFLQTGSQTTLDLTIDPVSTVSRSVFAQSTNPTDSFVVSVAEINAIGGTIVPNGPTGSITFNPDPSAPQIINPYELPTQDISIAQGEVYTPSITPVIQPGTTSNVTSPTTNSTIISPYVQNPAIKTNYPVQNPAIKTNTDINPAIKTNTALNTALNDSSVYNTAIATAQTNNQPTNDAIYAVTNSGNTSATYVVKLFNSNPSLSNLPRPLCTGAASTSCTYLQLLIAKQYLTNSNQGCSLSVQNTFVTYTNVNPVFTSDPTQLNNPLITDADPSNATVSLAPGETGFVILRTNLFTSELEQLVGVTAPVVVAHAANTGTVTPPATLAITNSTLPNGITTQSYSGAISTFGGQAPYTFSITSGMLPSGIQLNTTTGALTGAPTGGGSSTFTVSVTDSAPVPNTFVQTYTVNVFAQLLIAANSLPNGTVGSPYSQSIPTTGGSGQNYTWSAIGLPSFLTISPTTGTISSVIGQNGTPGTFPFTVSVSDPGPPAQMASQSMSVTFTEASVVTITASPNTIILGAPITISATVAPQIAGTGTPTGTVAVADSTGASCTITLSGGAGTCSLTPLALNSSDTVTGTYSGDSSFSGNTGSTTVAVSKDSTTLTVALNPTSAIVGQKVQASVTVTPVGTVSISPTGTVALSDGLGASCTATLSAGTQGQPSSGSCMLVPLSTGTRTVQATYGGDNNFLGSVSSASLSVSQAGTSTTVSSTQTTVAFGQTLTANFQVSASSPSTGTPAPTGTVTVNNSTGGSCTGSLSNGSGTCNLIVGGTGTSTLSGTYSGDANYTGSASPQSGGITVGKANSTTSVGTSPTATVVGQPYAVNVKISPAYSGVPTGSVAVSDGTNSCAIILSGGAGSCSLASSSTGTRTVTATYAGDGNFNGSAGATSQTVSVANTSTVITSTLPNPSVPGQAVTVKFTVTAAAPGAGTPTGNVTLTASTGETCSNSVAAGGCALTFAAAGSRTLTAVYGGDTNFAGSTSAPVTITQAVEDFSISVTPATETIPSGQQASFTIKLASIGGLTGNVNLSCSGAPPNSSCAVSPSTVDVNGTGSITTSVTLSTSRNVTHGTFTLTFTGIYGTGVPATGGITHSTTASLTVK